MPPKVYTLEQYAADVCQRALRLDWISRHQFLRAYARTPSFRVELKRLLAPDQWLHGKFCGATAVPGLAIALADRPWADTETETESDTEILGLVSQRSAPAVAGQRSAPAETESDAVAGQSASKRRRRWRRGLLQ